MTDTRKKGKKERQAGRNTLPREEKICDSEDVDPFIHTFSNALSN